MLNDQLYVEEHNKLDETRHLKLNLMSIFAGPVGLALMLLSVIAFGLSTYYTIMISGLDIPFEMNGNTYTLHQNIFTLSIPILISALVPIFYIGVYTNSKKEDEEKTANWFEYGVIYMKVMFVIMIVAGVFLAIAMVGVLFVFPILGLLLICLIILIMSLVLFFIRLVTQFFKSIRDNLSAVRIITKANPSKVLILVWISFILSIPSLSFTAVDTAGNIEFFTEEVSYMLNQFATVQGFIGFLISGAMLLLLYQINNKYTKD